jgi:hypothetical protein
MGRFSQQLHASFIGSHYRRIIETEALQIFVVEAIRKSRKYYPNQYWFGRPKKKQAAKGLLWGLTMCDRLVEGCYYGSRVMTASMT